MLHNPLVSSIIVIIINEKNDKDKNETLNLVIQT